MPLGTWVYLHASPNLHVPLFAHDLHGQFLARVVGSISVLPRSSLGLFSRSRFVSPAGLCPPSASAPFLILPPSPRSLSNATIRASAYFCSSRRCRCARFGFLGSVAHDERKFVAPICRSAGGPSHPPPACGTAPASPRRVPSTSPVRRTGRSAR